MIKKNIKILICVIAVLTLPAFHQANKLHLINITSADELHYLLSYSADRIPMVSAHRGGPRKGFPENCIPTFENTLKHTYALLEIDPRFTKDSVIVLMHDTSLERTSTGTGNVTDITHAELKAIRLKDTEGNVTGIPVPTLDEALEWAKGKAILVIDQKGVPMYHRVKKIQEHKAQANAMVIAYTMEDVKLCYKMDKNIMMEVPLPDMQKIKEFEATGVPWKNIIAFITHAEPKDPQVFDYLHQKGVLCIRGTSRNLDREYWKQKTISEAELAERYRKLIDEGTDIIEADLGIEAGTALKDLIPASGNRLKYLSY